jgi:hypothetical protein
MSFVERMDNPSQKVRKAEHRRVRTDSTDAADYTARMPPEHRKKSTAIRLSRFFPGETCDQLSRRFQIAFRSGWEASGCRAGPERIGGVESRHRSHRGKAQ